MNLNLIDSLIILGSSILTSLFVYYKIPIVSIQQVVILILLVLLFLYNRLYKPQMIFSPNLISKLFLFFSSFFVQLLIISTGSIFSPFFILFHLFTVTASFLISIFVGFSFLFFAGAVLVLNTILDPNQLQLVKGDPGTVLLYLVTMIVIIPISQIVAKKYHLKEEVSKLLTKQVQLGGSIIESLSEIVLVVDKNLKIVFANEALKKELDLSDGEILGKNVLEILDLKDADGNILNYESLPLKLVLKENVTRVVDGLFLYTKNKSTPFAISLQIRPITNPDGQVEQLTLIITEGMGTDSQHLKHADLQEAQKKEDAREKHLKDLLNESGLLKFASEFELLEKIEKDIEIARELEDHTIKENPTLTDLTIVAKNVLGNKLNLAKSFGVNLEILIPPEETGKEEAFLSLTKSDIPAKFMPVSGFSAPLDPKWLTIILEKLLDLAIFLSAGTINRTIQIILQQTNTDIKISLNASSPLLLENEKKYIFEKYYGNLASKTYLRLGSGLEGFIIKSLITQLNLPFKIELKQKPSQVTFELTILKKARS